MAGTGHVDSVGTSSTAKVRGQEVQVRAGPADGSDADKPGRSKGSHKVGEVVIDDPNRKSEETGKADPLGRYDDVDLNKSDLEMLPPRRRALVLKYFQSLRGTAPADPPKPSP